MSTSFSSSQFRKKALQSQGLLQRNIFGAGASAVLKCIEHLGYVQIDTISVVQRAHHHVLWNRVGNYQPRMLDKLVSDKKVFEYWFHAAAYMPMKDFRFALPRMQAIKSGQKHWFTNTDPSLMKKICQRIEVEGPLMAREFVDPVHRENGWWQWKPAKQALEQLFMQGDLMVIGREGFQKRYDLIERALPENIDTTFPCLQQQAQYLIDVTIRSHGFAALKSYTYLRKGAELKAVVKEQLEQAVLDGRLLKSSLPCETAVYCDLHMASRKRTVSRVMLLSPFDNTVIQRERCRRIFNFDYQIECYVPQAKRVYGYFCLPVLFRDQFVGRVDCKAMRKDGVLNVVHLQLDHAVDDDFPVLLADALREFAVFNGCSAINLGRVKPAVYKSELKALLRS